ncbi:c-type cytochrome [Siculibacillus lacustris]|uniref:C-type cytochrome n=1 Tax=Siculibacillus lacustris TaxID=1549641 RepID=A0A4V2KTG7_9HYPH|nr:c-type cytochrome [Siculibacillus lacustris]TBW37214.1 c-type cytochrome [Siculibacillus lacustris]
MKKVVMLAALGFVAAAGSASAADVAAGEKVFAKCKICHAIGEGATNKVGPQLNGVIGRKAGSTDFKGYGEGLKKLGDEGLVWDEAKLTQYVKDPKAFNPTTKMAFVGVKDDTDLANVVAYVAQFGADGKPK